MRLRMLAVLLLSLGLALPAAARTWTSDDGRYEAEGALIGIKDGLVTIRPDEGETITIPLQRLSQADQDHVRLVYDCTVGMAIKIWVLDIVLNVALSIVLTLLVLGIALLF